MSDLTLDVGVLMSGAGLGAPEFSEASRTLMDRMKDSPAACLVMDDGGFIDYQYREKLKDSFGAMWVRRMADLDKILHVRRKNLDRGTQTQLREAHFDQEDCKYYVRTAAGSPSKRLVSHDPDYSARVQRVIKKRLGIVVFPAEQATDLYAL